MQARWPRDFADVVRSIVPYWRDGGRCRIVTNAGGLNPLVPRRGVQRDSAGDRDALTATVAVVRGDDVLELVRMVGDDCSLRNLDTGQPIGGTRDRLVTANAYLGARPIAERSPRAADLVITGRVADPSLTVGPCAALVWMGVGRLGAIGRRDRGGPFDRVRHAAYRRNLHRLASDARCSATGVPDCRNRRGRKLHRRQASRQRRKSLRGDGERAASV